MKAATRIVPPVHVSMSHHGWLPMSHDMNRSTSSAVTSYPIQASARVYDDDHACETCLLGKVLGVGPSNLMRARSARWPPWAGRALRACTVVCGLLASRLHVETCRDGGSCRWLISSLIIIIDERVARPRTRGGPTLSDNGRMATLYSLCAASVSEL